MYGGYLFCLAQAYGECNYYDKTISAAIYACGLSDLMELYQNSSLLKKYINEDFSIILEY